MKRLHFLASYSTFFVGLFMFLIFTAMEKALGQKLVATPRYSFTPTTTQGQMYNIAQFPNFTAPSGKKVIFYATGRLSSINYDRTANITTSVLFNHGYTHLEHTRMALSEQGTPSDYYPSNLPKSQRAFIFGTGAWSSKDATSPFQLRWTVRNANEDGKQDPFFDYYDNNPNSTKQIFKYAIRGVPGYFPTPQGNLDYGTEPQGLDGLKNSFDFIVWDAELLTPQTINNNLLYSGSPGLQYNANDLPTKFKQATANRYVYMLQQTKDQASTSSIGSYEPSGPFNSIGDGVALHGMYSTPTANVDPWIIAASNTDDANSSSNLQRNFPSALNGKKMSDYANVITPGVYFHTTDFDSTIRHYDATRIESPSNAANLRHWLAYTIGEQEINGKLSSLPRYPFHWLFSETNYVQAPASIAEGLAIFPWFTNIGGVVHYDDSQGPVQSNRTYTCYENYIHGLYRLFYYHKDMFEGNPEYLQEVTNYQIISITNIGTNTIASNSNLINEWIGGTATQKATADYLREQKLPFVRTVVKDCDILVTATYPYAPSATQVKIVVRYPDKNWSDTITLNGDEVYLGRATMKPSLDNVTVNGSSNVSTPIFISSGSHTIYVAPSTNNTTYSYSVIYPSNSSVQLYPNGNYWGLRVVFLSGFRLPIAVEQRQGT